MIKHPKDWEEYISNVCKIYGFKRRLNPLAFTKEGKCIGGYQEMLHELDTVFHCNDADLEEEDHVDPSVLLASHS